MAKSDARTNRRRWAAALLALGACAALVLALRLTGALQLLSPTYSNEDFDIETYVSPLDADGDGVDDQTDIIESARSYVATRPAYGSAYYEGGWPNDGRGVCTDVVAYALLGAGYDVRTLLNEDLLAHPEAYDIEVPDIDIDYRRVEDLLVFFSRNATPLTLDPTDTEAWQGGDVVFFDGHVGIVSDRRNSRGIALVIHHERVFQVAYEEDVLEERTITGHFRVW